VYEDLLGEPTRYLISEGESNLEFKLLIERKADQECAETSSSWYYPEFHSARYQPEWSFVVDLVGGWIGITRKAGTVGTAICSAYRAFVHSQVGFFDCLEE